MDVDNSFREVRIIPGKIVTTTCLCGIAFLYCSLFHPLYSADEIEVKREKGKTTYSIGPDERGRREEEKNKERSREMLNKMNIVIDKRQNQLAGQ